VHVDGPGSPPVSNARSITIERTTKLHASPHDAFVAVNSPETAPLIDPGVRSWIPDTHPIGVGTRFTIRARLGLLPIRGTSEVVTWDPPTLVVYRSVKPSWPFSMHAEHRFEPIDDFTSYTWRITFTEHNIIARPMIRLAARLFRSALAAQAEALERFLIAQPRNS
jgi:Polyketide cyclase / dehydrase and lipid transport